MLHLQKAGQDNLYIASYRDTFSLGYLKWGYIISIKILNKMLIWDLINRFLHTVIII